MTTAHTAPIDAKLLVDGIDVPARGFALAWRAVIAAAGTDEDRQALYRTVLLELHPEGVVLVSTNGYLLLWAFVGHTELADADPMRPLLGQPIDQVLLRDASNLPAALFAYVTKHTALGQGVFDRDATLKLTRGSIEPHPDRPTLSPELDAPAVLAHYGTEAVAIPIIEGVEFPNWRAALDTGPASGMRRIHLDADLLRALASVRTDDRGAVELEMLGRARGVNFTVPGRPAIRGRLMPALEAERPEEPLAEVYDLERAFHDGPNAPAAPAPETDGEVVELPAKPRRRRSPKPKSGDQ